MCTVLLPLGDNPIAVNKYIMPYHIKYQYIPCAPFGTKQDKYNILYGSDYGVYLNSTQWILSINEFRIQIYLDYPRNELK